MSSCCRMDRTCYEVAVSVAVWQADFDCEGVVDCFHICTSSLTSSRLVHFTHSTLSLEPSRLSVKQRSTHTRLQPYILLRSDAHRCRSHSPFSLPLYRDAAHMSAAEMSLGAIVSPHATSPVIDEQHSSPDFSTSQFVYDSPIPSSLYEDEDASIPAFILSSPLPPSPWESYLMPDEPRHSVSPPAPSLPPAVVAAAAMPAQSPRLSYSVSAIFNTLPATVIASTSNSSTASRSALLTMGGTHNSSPSPFGAAPVVLPTSPLAPTDSDSDDGVEVLRAVLKRKRTVLERREQRRRLREQQTASSASPSPQPADQQIIDAEAEAAADIVDLTSDNHALLELPAAPKPLPPPVEVATEPPSPPVSKHQCPICLSAAEELASLKCGHVFCLNCVRTAVQLNHRCPTCRTKAGLRDIRRLYM